MIGYAAENDVTINSVALSYPASTYMDSLIPITGGMSYSDQDGIDALIGQILNDHAAQKEAVKNIAAGDSDGDGLQDTDEIGGMVGANGHTYYSNPYEKDSDRDGFEDGEEMGELDGQIYKMLSDPRDENSYCRMLGDSFIEVNEG